MPEAKEAKFYLNLFDCWRMRQEQTEIQVAWRQQRLISALAIQGPRARRYVSGLLWPESTDTRAMESLRRSIHLISHQIPGLLVNNGPVLSLSEGVQVDLHELLNQVKVCEASSPISADDWCLGYLKRADLLPGWYDDWVLVEQHRLQSIRLRALLLHARWWLDSGDPDKAFEAAEAALELEPLYESAVRILICADLKMGNQARAWRSFEDFRGKLSRELGVCPSDDLIKLATLQLRTA